MTQTLAEKQFEMRNRPRRTKKPKGKKRNRGLSAPELARRIAKRTALLETQQEAMRQRTQSPTYIAKSAATAKGLAKQKARLTVKLELRAARKMKKTLAYQRKRYKAHLQERRKMTWRLRAEWQLTMDTWKTLRESCRAAEQRLRSATRAFEDLTINAQRAKDVTRGFELGREWASRVQEERTQ